MSNVFAIINSRVHHFICIIENLQWSIVISKLKPGFRSFMNTVFVVCCILVYCCISKACLTVIKVSEILNNWRFVHFDGNFGISE